MARKTKEESQATYAALLDAAEHVFREKGVTHTTLNDVANAAELTRGAIYWHFKDKAALFQALCDRAFLPMDALYQAIYLAHSVDPLASLKQLSIQLLKNVAQDERQRKVFEIIFHRCEKTQDLAMFLQEQEKRTECLSQMDTLIAEAVKQGQLPADTDTFIAMQATHGFLVGLLHEWSLAPEAYDLAQHAEAMVELFLAGLVAKPPRKK